MKEMRRTINNIISVAYTFVKLFILKLFNWKGLSFSVIERFSPNVVTEFSRGSRVRLGKQVRVHSGTKIKVRKGGELNIGANAKINYNCIIVCHERICIGEGTAFGPSVYVYDHDHDYKKGINENSFICAPVNIGKNCWIGAHSTILKGVTIGDNSVIGAGSVITKDVPDNSVITLPHKYSIKRY